MRKLAVKGRNLITGLPAAIGVSVQELRAALQESLKGFVDTGRVLANPTLLTGMSVPPLADSGTEVSGP